MATEPQPSTGIIIERLSDYRHVVADQVAAIFLGTDYDLSFLASAPRPIMQISDTPTETQLQADARVVESVRIRMNTTGVLNAITALVGTAAQNSSVDLDMVQRDINTIIDNARRSRNT
ncbi:hypothetical protein K7957_07630 [Sphingomonas yunnanensis]|uniref:hypothetical protein n=1 Tax=Sphingomonas yunnanensis TaxID=310400 RepID=UPI001CA71021|nr:hypothetical protein [Sphingomonas yunnanensis]MBY9062798.1 hypothetical protein [Sphingomonas yunnanensis]